MINENSVLLTQKIESSHLLAATKGVANKVELDSLVVGERYHAIIESKLNNGWTRVFVAGQLLQMALPDSITHQESTEIEIVLISKEPTLKFLLPNSLINLDQKQNIASISQTGQLLSGLLKATNNLQATFPQQTALTPIIQSPLSSVVELASKLQRALTESGLFYESHLAQWLTGKRSFDQLHREPQLKLSETDKNQGSTQFIQQQLMALETGTVAWKGEVWSGQLLEWVVIEQENEGRQETRKNSNSSNWISHINVTLPCLGQIMITLHINKLDTSIHIKTAQDTTNNLLAKNQSKLIKAIEAEGIKVLSVIVNKDGSTNN